MLASGTTCTNTNTSGCANYAVSSWSGGGILLGLLILLVIIVVVVLVRRRG
jgi:hypothetical protein